MGQDVNLSIILPAYNEEGTIEKVIDFILDKMKHLNIEILVIDDGSTDNTSKSVKNFVNRYSNIFLFRHEKNMGYADAIKTGFKHCKGNLIAIMDSDLQNNPEDVLNMMNYIESGYDVVVGWRKYRKDPIYRLIISKIYNFFINLIFGLNVVDVNGKPKLLKLDVIRKLELTTKQWAVDVELIHKAKRLGYKFTQVPVSHSFRSTGKSKLNFKREIKSLISLLGYRLRVFNNSIT